MKIESCMYIAAVLMFILGICGVFNLLPAVLSLNFMKSCAYAGRTAVVRCISQNAFLRRRRISGYEKEIFESISVMRNMISIGDAEQCGADYMISSLIDRGGKLKPLYVNMLSYLRVGDREHAITSFVAEVDSVIGKEFAGLLVRWDEINPRELSEILISHQRTLKGMWVTAEKRREELLSDIIYLPVVINVMLVFINFIYVVFFLEQREMWNMIF